MATVFPPTLPAMQEFDVAIIGAGAAGLFCASVAGQLGLRVVLIDHSPRVAEKIRISGGGRSNFTNTSVSAANYLGQNPRFAKSALARYRPQDFLELVRKHGIGFHEKHKGQLFCDRSAQDLIDMLLAECGNGGVSHWQPCAVRSIRFSASSPCGKSASSYELDSDRGAIRCSALVIATGGLSIPKIGATGFGYRVAEQFQIPVVSTRPALVPLSFDAQQWAPFSELSGLSLPVDIATGGKKDGMQFQEDLLFTHRGLSGPAVLQISSYWTPGTPVRLNLAPGSKLADALLQAKGEGNRRKLTNVLSTLLPSRLADTWIARGPALGHDWQRPVNECSDKALLVLGEQLARWEITPTGTEGYAKAEVTAGGVDTAALSSQTMESRQSGLYFIGEVVDITGWLGGYNFQWAWSSAFACAQALAVRLA
ncbi:NAD(P)/FAD-dependent oxidoreductase [Curvibacter sp. APW13]|uniref:NAD(P)/FAD-dependent oxidoreductase n=1 Tax=Curvibacter sp. APW13 TaxID=3077236 RepID=UPI0028E002D0|nr:NAD(P)/FAD-dependent oxidoreductase [Curvibacter sp. APW13]MDT8991154.1 NAD(P)/FAD-dependent oxidoreductase [Curvibacter sp. APW13]